MNHWQLKVPLWDDDLPDIPRRARKRLRRLFAVLEEIAERWTRFSVEWKSIRAKVYSEQIPEIVAGLIALRCMFQGLNQPLWLVSCGGLTRSWPAKFEQRPYSSPSLFHRIRSRDFAGVRVDFRPHLGHVVPDCEWDLLLPALAKWGVTESNNLIDESLGAVMEDITAILEIILGHGDGLPTIDKAMWEVFRLAAHSLDHCELAVEQIDDCIGRVYGIEGEERTLS